METALRNIYYKLKNSTAGYILVYTLIFLAVSLTAFRHFISLGKTTILVGDGLSQNYNTLLYYSRLLRGIISGLLRDGSLNVPMWDISAGLGEDILGVMHYYGVGEPIMLLAALVPPSRTDYLYCLIYLARLYLGGLAFSWFSLWHHNRKAATLLGSFVYIFSGYSLTLAIKHLMFGVPIVFFPLILLGADKIIRDKKPLCFVLSTAFAAMSNIYFFYAMVIFAGIYCIFRLVCVRKEFGAVDYAKTVITFAAASLTAFLISAVITLPVLSLLVSENRAGRGYAYTLTYGLKYYFEYVAGFTNLQQAEDLMTTGYSVVGALALILLFLKKKKYTRLKLGAVFFGAFSFIPWFAYMMNGFSYVTNRWVWALAMFMGYVTARVYPELFSLTKEEGKRIAAAALVICLISLVLPSLRNSQTLCSASMLLFTALLILLCDFKNTAELKVHLGTSLVFIIGLFLMTGWLWAPENDTGGKYSIGKFTDINTADEILEKRNSDAAMELVGDKGIYRTGEIGVSDGGGNSALLRDVILCRRYFSMMLPNVSAFIRELCFNTQMDFKLESTDRRGIMDSLLSVKYYNVKEGMEGKKPVFYDKKAAEADTYDGHACVWLNENSLPLGYTYDQIINESELLALDPAGRQEAMLYGAALKEEDAAELPLKKAELKPERRSVLKSISQVSGGEADITEKGIDLKGRDAVFVLETEGLDDSETYVMITGTDFKGRKQREAYTDEEWGALSRYEQWKIRAGEFLARPEDSAKMQFGTAMGEYTNVIEYFTPAHSCYTGHDSFITNLGYNEDGIKEIYLKLDRPGYYSFDSLDVVCQPMKSAAEEIKKLGKEALESAVVDTNSISGVAEVSDDKLMVLSIPFSTGWRAYVDAQEIKTCCANLMFLAFPLRSGRHEIVLRYETPFLRQGAYLTAAGTVVLLIWLILMRVKKSGSGKERKN